MAQEEQPANAGTDSAGSAQSTTPKWDSFDGEMFPFLSLNEEKKRAGFRVQFLTNKPRKRQRKIISLNSSNSTHKKRRFKQNGIRFWMAFRPFY